MKSICFLALLLTGFSAYSQDYVYKLNGDKVAAKVVEVDKYTVTYRMFDNPNGPIYKINRSELVKIEYQNGTVENYNFSPSSGTADLSTDFNKNMMGFDFFSLMLGEVGFSYERILSNGVIGLRVPIIFGLNMADYQDIKEVRANFVSGLDVNLYPTGQGKVRYFIGPAIRVGSVYADNSLYYNPNDLTPNQNDERVTMTAFQVNNGVLFQPTRDFNISIVLGIGLRNLDISRSYHNDIAPNYGTFSANMIYRFGN